MSQRSSGSAGRPADDDWPDDLWPDTGGAPGHDPADGPRGTAPAPGHDPADGPRGTAPAPGHVPAGGDPHGTAPPKRRHWPVTLTVVVVVAAGAGAAISAVAAHVLSGPPTAPRPGGRQVIVGPPAGGPPGGGSLPGGAAGQGGSLFLIGKVLAVSPASITIGGPAHTITARVTAATRVTGAARSITGIKVGDRVSAQIDEGGGRSTAVSISDPAQLPGGGQP
jgi:hypothetical protein